MHITLRSNEKLYINGAVLKVDRKTSIELMNDAVFLLEAHIMLERNATTPMRQLYYVIQLMLMGPQDIAENLTLFRDQHRSMAAIHHDPAILDGLARISGLVDQRRYFEALKLVRTLMPVEDKLMSGPQQRALAAAS